MTLFNDMCLLAPGTLIDPDIAWDAVDATTARARFTYRGQTIAATLLFASTGELVNFQSDDRARAESNGTFTPRRFSTPVRDYRDFGPVRLMSFGEARWLLQTGSSPKANSTSSTSPTTGIDDNARSRSSFCIRRSGPFLRAASWRFPLWEPRGHYAWAADSDRISFLVECGVLAMNRGRCPLTDAGPARHTGQRTSKLRHLPATLASSKQQNDSSARCSSSAVCSCWLAS